MHPVLGTMMPEICEAPHLPELFLHSPSRSEFKWWGAFISFLQMKASTGGFFPSCVRLLLEAECQICLCTTNESCHINFEPIKLRRWSVL